jgi:hypothetical protein
MKVGMAVKVMPAHRRSRRGRRLEGRAATVLELPTESRGRARVRFAAGGTARVSIGRLIKP